MTAHFAENGIAAAQRLLAQRRLALLIGNGDHPALTRPGFELAGKFACESRRRLRLQSNLDRAQGDADGTDVAFELILQLDVALLSDEGDDIAEMTEENSRGRGAVGSWGIFVERQI